MTEQSLGKTIQDAISGVHPIILDTQYADTKCWNYRGQMFVSVARFNKLHDPNTYTYLVHREDDTELFTIDVPKDVADGSSQISLKTRPHFEIYSQRCDKNYATEAYRRWLETTFMDSIIADPEQREIYYYIIDISVADSTTQCDVKLSDDFPYVIELCKIDDPKATRFIDFMTFAQWVHTANPSCFPELFETK